MKKLDVLLVPKPIITVPNSEVNNNYGPFTRIVNNKGFWHITALAYFNSEFKTFEQLFRGGLPFMYDNLLPLQKIIIVPDGPITPIDEISAYTLWEFSFKLEKDPVCCGVYFEIDFKVHEHVPTRGTVVMGQTL